MVSNNEEDVPIRDASTVILIRKKEKSIFVLMGQRGRNAVFMPSKYVFPGGAVDEQDAEVELVDSLDRTNSRLLEVESKSGISKALSVAAIRELWEESGLRLCKNVSIIENIPEGWEDFCSKSFLPDASKLQFVFRAITPPGRPRRFDARFFLCDAEYVNGSLDDFSEASTELQHLHWIDINEVNKLNLPFITEVVLNEVREILKSGQNKKGVPFFRHGASSDFIFLN
jgi:8-oxo-dGTP pyrophosphatase MutT (NUDIX family)